MQSTKRRTKRKIPEVVFRQGKATAVILDIEEYQEMLERLEDLEDLKMLHQVRKRPLSFRALDDFLKENSPRVGASLRAKCGARSQEAA